MSGRSRADVAYLLFEESVRGFFFEMRLPGEKADEWTDEIVAIAREHGLTYVTTTAPGRTPAPS